LVQKSNVSFDAVRAGLRWL